MKAPPPTRSQTLRTGLALAAALSSARADLSLRLKGTDASDRQSAAGIALHVDPGGTPSPFLPTGPFTATWEGTLSVELRGDFQFRADTSHPFQLDIAGTNLTWPAKPQSQGAWSAPVRLRKGTNALRATWITDGPSGAPASLRVLWKGRGLPEGVIPPGVLESTPISTAPQSDPDRQRTHGRALFLERRCGHCHTVDASSPVPELAMHGPAFDLVGPGRDPAWIAQWVLDPSATRHGAWMPRLLHGPLAAREAAAIAAWMASLPPRIPRTPAPAAGSAPVGKALAESLRCQSCHNLPGGTSDPTRIDLTGIQAKFRGSPAALRDYLVRPSSIHPWGRMPDFGLSTEEAAHLSAWLVSADPNPPGSEAEPDPGTEATRAEGLALAESRGCFACHEAPGIPIHPPPALPLRALRATDWNRGCAGPAPSEKEDPSCRPWYPLTQEERTDLQAFGKTDGTSLSRHVPAEFSERWTVALRCADCHRPDSGLPGLAGAGAKLKPEWLTRLLRGDLPSKTRPWLPARMPAFPWYAERLAAGLAAQHGLPPSTPPESPLDPALAADGRRLVSASGGFACVSCHAVGPSGATAVFEAPGINFTRVAERLHPDYFRRWLLNPQIVDPGTKMPRYFDEEGNSALADYAEGDGPKTLNALWSYLRLGDRMEPPAP